MANGCFRKMKFTDGILLSALALVGSYHEYISCALSAVMGVYLLLKTAKTGKLQIKKSLMALAVSVLCLAYGLTCLWAVDRGMAFVGFLKFLPLILYLLCLWQEEGETCALEVLPYFGAIMTVVSVIGMQIPVLKTAFSVAGRLAGFFQYPNTFAVFLLVCELLILKKSEKKIWDWLALFVLVAGILYSGSRTAFVIFILANIAMVFAVGGKTTRYAMAGLLGGICVLGVILAIGGNAIMQRYLNISLTESTFVGRLLYVADALPLLLKHPFGMGYMGYYYVQSSIQTGVYDVMFVHNDFMQFVLDAGLIPGVLLMASLIAWFCNSQAKLPDKIIVGALCLHSLFDFNLQFTGVFLLLLLLLETNNPGRITRTKAVKLPQVGAVVACALSVYIGLALLLSHFGQYQMSDTLYPYNTQNKLKMLSQATELQEANALADEILQQNTSHYAPYSIKAKYSYSKGDIGAMIQYKKMTFARKPFAYEEYEEYCQMLINGIALYEQMADQNSIEICKRELLATQQRLEENAKRLSKLGSLIDDQPVTKLPDALQEYINRVEE